MICRAIASRTAKKEDTFGIHGGNGMKILLIGGTGTISSAITRQLAETNHEVYLLNRGNNNKHLPNN